MTQHILFHLHSGTYSVWNGTRYAGVVDVGVFRHGACLGWERLSGDEPRSIWKSMRETGDAWYAKRQKVEGYPSLMLLVENDARSVGFYGVGSREDVEKFLADQERDFPAEVFDSVVKTVDLGDSCNGMVWFSLDRLARA